MKKRNRTDYSRNAISSCRIPQTRPVIPGSTKYIDFHMLFCKRLLIDEAHELANNLESEISREVKNADVVIHIEPCNYECDLTEATCTIRLGRKT